VQGGCRIDAQLQQKIRHCSTHIGQENKKIANDAVIPFAGRNALAIPIVGFGALGVSLHLNLMLLLNPKLQQIGQPYKKGGNPGFFEFCLSAGPEAGAHSR